jgi:hypothetical protein
MICREDRRLAPVLFASWAAFGAAPTERRLTVFSLRSHAEYRWCQGKQPRRAPGLSAQVRHDALSEVYSVRKHSLAALAAIVVFALTAGSAGSALAHPAETIACSGCHTLSSAVVLSALPISTTTTSTTYSISVNNPFGTNAWAVFAGSTKQAGSAGSTATVTLPNGATYSVFGVSGDGATTQGYAAVAVAPGVKLTYKYTYKFNFKKKVYKKLRAVLKSNATGKKYTVTVSKKGVAAWKKLPAGKYRLSTTGNARFKFKARTVKVGP